jgi:hypothetical protein
MAETDQVERRRALRMRTLKKGRIVVESKSTFNCTVRNLSATGGRLELPSVVGVPDSFVLDVVDGPKLLAHVVWKTFTALGVAFDD